MTAKLGIREGAISATVFAAVLFALISVDARVHDRMSDLFTSGSVTPWGDRAGDLFSALWAAARYQSFDNAPVLIFVTVGVVLMVFMFRS
jgi:hypothetical protein